MVPEKNRYTSDSGDVFLRDKPVINTPVNRYTGEHGNRLLEGHEEVGYSAVDAEKRKDEMKEKLSSFPIKKILFCITIFILAFFAFYRINYDKAVHYANNGDYAAAQAKLAMPKIAKAFNGDFVEFVDTMNSCDIEKASSVEKTLKKLNDLKESGYPPKTIDKATASLFQSTYEYATQQYENGDYKSAAAHFGILNNYEDSDIYYAASITMAGNSNRYTKLIENIKHVAAKKALLYSNKDAIKFLFGSWHTPANDKYYYFIVDYNYNCSFN